MCQNGLRILKTFSAFLLRINHVNHSHFRQLYSSLCLAKAFTFEFSSRKTTEKVSSIQIRRVKSHLKEILATCSLTVYYHPQKHEDSTWKLIIVSTLQSFSLLFLPILSHWFSTLNIIFHYYENSWFEAAKRFY